MFLAYYASVLIATRITSLCYDNSFSTPGQIKTKPVATKHVKLLILLPVLNNVDLFIVFAFDLLTIKFLHHDKFLAKVPGLCPVLASGDTTSLYCWPLAVIKKFL